MNGRCARGEPGGPLPSQRLVPNPRGPPLVTRVSRSSSTSGGRLSREATNRRRQGFTYRPPQPQRIARQGCAPRLPGRRSGGRAKRRSVSASWVGISSCAGVTATSRSRRSFEAQGWRTRRSRSPQSRSTRSSRARLSSSPIGTGAVVRRSPRWSRPGRVDLWCRAMSVSGLVRPLVVVSAYRALGEEPSAGCSPPAAERKSMPHPRGALRLVWP